MLKRNYLSFRLRQRHAHPFTNKMKKMEIIVPLSQVELDKKRPLKAEH